MWAPQNLVRLGIGQDLDETSVEPFALARLLAEKGKDTLVVFDGFLQLFFLFPTGTSGTCR
jgi:hypothetical protein